MSARLLCHGLGRGGLRRSPARVSSFSRALTTEAPSSVSSSQTGREHDSTKGRYGLGTVAVAGMAGVAGGILIEKEDHRFRSLAKTSGFRTCCDVVLTDKQKNLQSELEAIVGKSNVKANVDMKGSRIGRGTAMLCVKPASFEEAVKILKACVAADVAVLPQGANTSLTGASVPRDTKCDRPCVVVNLRRLNKLIPIGEDGKQVLCFAGAGIWDLQNMLKAKFKRDSHSVLGSIFLNPTVGAGVAFGSGGTQIRKGPAFTERALWLRVLDNGSVELCNTLGLKDNGDIFSLLESKEELSMDDVDPKCKAPASWPDYPKVVTNLDDKPSRFNADTRGIDPNRSEGKVLILATIHDTWPIPPEEKRVWVSCRTLELANKVKREVCLSSTSTMSRSCEYFNREIYDATDRGGRLCVEMIYYLGMRPIGMLWDIKRFIETLPIPFASMVPEMSMWILNYVMPRSLPKELQKLGDAYDHHLLMDFSEYNPGEIKQLQALLDKFVSSQPQGDVAYHICEDAKQKERANLFRFVMAIAFRVYCTGTWNQGLSIDYAWPKSRSDWPVLPAKYDSGLKKRCVYSHYGCNVFHEDLVFGPEVDVEAAKHDIKHAIEEQGGRLPAEHGHGTEYHAPADTQARWKKMDPLNVMNPGVGGLSYNKLYASKPCCANHA